MQLNLSVIKLIILHNSTLFPGHIEINFFMSHYCMMKLFSSIIHSLKGKNNKQAIQSIAISNPVCNAVIHYDYHPPTQHHETARHIEVTHYNCLQFDVSAPGFVGYFQPYSG